jgi:hypothetical protein
VVRSILSASLLYKVLELLARAYLVLVSSSLIIPKFLLLFSFEKYQNNVNSSKNLPNPSGVVVVSPSLEAHPRPSSLSHCRLAVARGVVFFGPMGTGLA